MHKRPDYSAPVAVDPAAVFPDNAQQRIFLSKAAQLGPDSFERFKTGQSDLPDPTSDDVVGQVPRLFSGGSADGFANAWKWVYAVLFMVSFGLVSLLLDVAGGRAKRRMLPLKGALSIGSILLLRLAVFRFWQRTQRKEPVAPGDARVEI
jgi:hypothetical protein